jgi:NAD(P)-dependent dehydrogenase (short-subunit alcohol dehydrogenase family)
VLSGFRLDGRIALVTGAGAGIGEAVAYALAEAGAQSVLVGRSGAPLEALAARIAAAGLPTALVRPCDVLDTPRIQAIIAALSTLDILVNNAGTNIPEPFVEVTEQHLDAILNLNTRAYFLVAQAAARKMLEHPDRRARGGAIINMSSQMGHIGSPNRTVYCMSKHAVEGLTKAMAVELAPQHIRVNSIGPTFVETPLVQRIVDTPEKRHFVLSRIPMGEMAQLPDIAGAAVFLASPAAAMITGAALLVDGGWTAQ